MQKWKVKHPNHDERIVVASTEKEAVQKYFDLYGIGSTTLPMSVEKIEEA